MSDIVPKDLSGVLVEGEKTPGLRPIVVGRGDVAVEADAEFRFFGGDDGGEVDGVTPDDR